MGVASTGDPVTSHRKGAVGFWIRKVPRSLQREAHFGSYGQAVSGYSIRRSELKRSLVSCSILRLPQPSTDAVGARARRHGRGDLESRVPLPDALFLHGEHGEIVHGYISTVLDCLVFLRAGRSRI